MTLTKQYFSIIIILVLFCLATIVTLLASFGETATKQQQQEIIFNVIHAPNLTQIDPSNKMAIRIEGTHEIYVLDNSKTQDRLVHTATAPLTNNQSYQYVILDKDNQIIDAEPFYRTLSSSSTDQQYEFYGHANVASSVNKQQQSASQLPPVHYQSSKDDYQYKGGLDRDLVHPNDDIPTFHIILDPGELNRLYVNILQDITVEANVTRICKNKLENFQHVKMELSGQTSRLFKKLSYSINLDKKDSKTGSFNGYRRFKLRSCATDPSYLREKLYYDMLYAANLPTARASFIR